jgi:hypothetical protein
MSVLAFVARMTPELILRDMALIGSQGEYSIRPKDFYRIFI